MQVGEYGSGITTGLDDPIGCTVEQPGARYDR